MEPDDIYEEQGWEYRSSPDDIYRHEHNNILYNKVWNNNSTVRMGCGKVWAVPCKGQGCDETPRQLHEASLLPYRPEDNIIEVGDIVVLKSGTTHQIVEEVIGDRITTSYSGKVHNSNVNRPTTDYKLVIKAKGTNEMTNSTPKLYEITKDEEVVYGYKLAVNSAGQWVMETKGTGNIVAVDKSQVEEVMPHTVAIRFNNDTLGSDYHFFSDKGSVEVGKFYLNENFDIFKVVSVDTKSKTATKDLKVVGKLVLE